MPRQTTPVDPLHLEQFLPYRLSVLANIVSATIAAAYAEKHQLSIPEWRVIAVLAREPGLSAAEVAERTAMDKVAVSRAVSGLLRRHRIVRSKARWTAADRTSSCPQRVSPSTGRSYPAPGGTSGRCCVRCPRRRRACSIRCSRNSSTAPAGWPPHV